MTLRIYNIKTLLPQQASRYASFPTALAWREHLYVYYRLGVTDEPFSHGNEGEVHKLTIPLHRFIEAFDFDRDLIGCGRDDILFRHANEMDAIVSQQGESMFSLATRTFEKGMQGMRTYLTLAEQPHFPSRRQIILPQLSWLVFYGHGLQHDQDYIFPAYGGLQGDGPLMRPLLLATAEGEHFSLLGHLPASEQLMFNESSLVYFQDQYHIFMRRHGKPYGIWSSQSIDLVHWQKPRPLLEHAQAPMAMVYRGRLLLTYRHILGENRAAVGLIEPFGKTRLVLDPYEGSIYDGGYADPLVINNRLFIFYYHGNPEGEPTIRCAELI